MLSRGSALSLGVCRVVTGLADVASLSPSGTRGQVGIANFPDLIQWVLKIFVWFWPFLAAFTEHFLRR